MEKYFSGGDATNSLICHNSRNICHSEERFSVFYSSSQALSNDILFIMKSENLYNTCL